MDIVELEDALPEAHAPVDEPATSADELGEDDEAVCLLSLSPLRRGAWVVLHGIVGKPELNGRVGVLDDPLPETNGDQRWTCHMLLEQRAISIKPANLSVMAPCTWKCDLWPAGGDECRRQMERTEAVVTRVLESFVVSDAAELKFPLMLSGEARNKVHSVCSELRLDKESIGQGVERYIIVRKRAADEGPSSTGALQEQGDLNDLRFVELVELLDRCEAVLDLDAIGGTIPGAAEARKQRSAQFWAAPPRHPRHARRGLFAAIRLMMPFHDLRRYGISAVSLATWAAEAVGYGTELAKHFGKGWMLDPKVRQHATGDLALVLQALWEERVDSSRAATAAARRQGQAGITVRDVNDVLDVVAGIVKPPAGSSRRATLMGLLGRASGKEVKWLVRILQRDVRIGARPKQASSKVLYDVLGEASKHRGSVVRLHLLTHLLTRAARGAKGRVAEDRHGRPVPCTGASGHTAARQPAAHVHPAALPQRPRARLQEGRDARVAARLPSHDPPGHPCARAAVGRALPRRWSRREQWHCPGHRRQGGEPAGHGRRLRRD